MSCAPTCTDTDVLAGIAQLSAQLHGLSAYLFVSSLVFLLLAVLAVVFLFVLLRVSPRV